MFIRSRVDGKKIIRAILNGDVVWRGYRYLFDDFTSGGLSPLKWDIIDPDNSGNWQVVDDIYSIINDSGDTGQSYAHLVGIISKLTFPVGTVLRARVRNPLGRHASLIGMAESTPTSPGLHAGQVRGFSWYSRADNLTSVPGSYRDENGQSGYIDVSGDDFTDFSVMELVRESSSVIKFYRDGVLARTLENVKFENEYKVFFMTDSWSLITRLDVDWVEVIGPLE